MTTRGALRQGTAMAAAMMLCACVNGEGVGAGGAVRTTALLDTSRPYYLEPCRADPAQMEYRLIPAAGLRAWRDAKAPFAKGRAETNERKAAAAERKDCLIQAQIKNGQPLAIRLNSVAMGGLATYDASGKCTKICERDIAVVLDINGSPTLQEPIIAYYQRGVRSDGVLSFQDQTIFTQEQWFVRNPPNIRVRLYDVRDDKDRILRDRLEMIGRGFNQVKDYIAGASVAGPVVNAAILAAEQLISGPRNKLIMSMEFQLYPSLDESTKPEEKTEGETGKPPAKPLPTTAELIQRAAPAPLSSDEIGRVREALEFNRTDNRRKVRFNPDVQAALRAKVPEVKDELNDTPRMYQAARVLISPAPREIETTGSGDAAFGAFLFALPYVVFNEGAQAFDSSCDGSVHALKKPLAPSMRGRELPPFYFMPAGRFYGGARIHSKADAADASCALDTPHVLFTITRDTGAVSLDVAKRMSELRTKFAANSGISADLVEDLSGTLVDAELALRIDTLENTRRVYDLISLIETLGTQLKDAAAAGAARKPMPKETQRGRAYRLIGAYTGCSITDAVDLAGMKTLNAELGQLDNAERGPKALTPYFKPKTGSGFTCPKLGEQVTTPVKPTPTPTPTPTATPDQPVVQALPPAVPAPRPGEIQVQDPSAPVPPTPDKPGPAVVTPEPKREEAP